MKTKSEAERFVIDYPECADLQDVNWKKFPQWRRNIARAEYSREVAGAVWDGRARFINENAFYRDVALGTIVPPGGWH